MTPAAKRFLDHLNESVDGEPRLPTISTSRVEQHLVRQLLPVLVSENEGELYMMGMQEPFKREVELLLHAMDYYANEMHNPLARSHGPEGNRAAIGDAFDMLAAKMGEERAEAFAEDITLKWDHLHYNANQSRITALIEQPSIKNIYRFSEPQPKLLTPLTDKLFLQMAAHAFGVMTTYCEKKREQNSALQVDGSTPPRVQDDAGLMKELRLVATNSVRLFIRAATRGEYTGVDGTKSYRIEIAKLKQRVDLLLGPQQSALAMKEIGQIVDANVRYLKETDGFDIGLGPSAQR